MAKNCICAADLRHYLEIQTVSESATSGGAGETTETWSTEAKVWAKIDTQGSREVFRASQVYPTATHVVTIRYRTGMTTKKRLKFGTRILGITGIENPQEENVMLLLTCVEAI